jgi:hypothetical protein
LVPPEGGIINYQLIRCRALKIVIYLPFRGEAAKRQRGVKFQAEIFLKISSAHYLQ